MQSHVVCPHCHCHIDTDMFVHHLPRCKQRHEKSPKPIDNSASIDEQVEFFRSVITDRSRIPMTIELPVAMGMAALLQIALKHPDVIYGTDNLVAMMRPFTDLLIEAIVMRSGEHAEAIRLAFARGWDADNDVTRQEFDLIHGDTEPFFTDEN
jgi:hypothetical protein